MLSRCCVRNVADTNAGERTVPDGTINQEDV